MAFMTGTAMQDSWSKGQGDYQSTVFQLEGQAGILLQAIEQL